MENGIRSGSENLEKFNIKIKSKPKDGLILQLHHTIRKPNGESKRIRFSTGSFDDAQEKLACADNVGNIFILDFIELKFWKVSSQYPCTSLHFDPHKSDLLIVALDKNFSINYTDIESGAVSLTLTGHTAPIKHISFSNNKTNNLLTASQVEAILWELRNYTKYFTLNTYCNAQIQQIMFAPAGDYLVACFQNDTLQIWRHETMKSIKQIIPNELKHLKTIAFTMNGRAMAMAGLTPLLILFCMDTWKSIKSIDLLKYNISGTQQVAFIPQIFDGGANKVLALLSSDCVLYFLDLEVHNIIHIIHPESSGIRKFEVSPTGKYFLCVLQLGEVNIYNTSYVMDLAHSKSGENFPKKLPCSSITQVVKKHVNHSHEMNQIEVEHKMRTCMDVARLRRILMQYGEYPDKYRSMIWRSLLATPRNKMAYSALIDKGIHPAYKDIEKQFSIHSSITLKNLKRLLSCLAHWSPLFGVMKFLPSFVFPFVKVLQKDPLLLFECVATVLLNQCQLWFEYAPFPPISVLSMIENILAEHDQKLLEHFCRLGITSQTYALKILETAFSEVLTCSEWLILWDHILSNEPAFILMAVVSYNIVQRSAIRRLNKPDQLENFFHMQNPINKKMFLKKAYTLLNETPEEIHPRRFINTFVSLEKGSCYQQFNGYPKATICLKLARKERNKPHKNETSSQKQSCKKQDQVLKQYNSESNNSDSDVHCERKHRRKKQNSRKCETGDIGENLKDEFINSIMCPNTQYQQSHHSEKSSQKQDTCKNTHKSRSKSKSSVERNNNLEQEIKKIMRSCSNSDV